ncbi:amidohydrolase family protein [Aquipseudomonas ullengensis]|uniref:Amidohydrolase family protein n=1 Tax=Aquipseudomonas ullengensis TaxID=2759166 RepID=A0A7W4LQ83_9GAMM|nr:amidohydrolase family protein [Pseudomonas ullengensis]MBB2497361.1 amidohydrolase family protein [Pseudomonas ullengensis]
MGNTNYPIYDCDQHYYEPPEAFLRHLPKQFRNDFQYVQINGRTKLAVGGVISDYIPNPTFSHVADIGSHEGWYRGDNPEGLSLREYGGAPIPSHPAFHNGAEHLKVMDKEGIHAAIILPTLASVIEERLEHKPESIQALFHSLNMWVADEYGFGNGRQFPAGAINLSDCETACKELDFLLAAGARCVLVRPAPVAGIRGSRSHGFKEFDPFWARINESKIFVIHHVSDSGYNRIYRWWTAGGQGEFRPFEKDPFNEMLDWMGRPIADSLSALVCHGVFDRFPDVRVAVLENGSSWLEPLLQRFEHVYSKMPKSFQRDPVESFREHVFLAPFYEDPVDKVVELLGADRVLFGSDWPHPEGLKRPLDFFKDIENLSAADTKKIMHSNLKGLLEGARN